MRGLGRRPLSLRARLLLTVLGLLVAVFAVVGVLTQALLRDYLVHRLDTQLADAGSRSVLGVGGYGRPPGFVPPGADADDRLACLEVSGQSAGTLCAVVRGGAVVGGGLLGASGSSSYLPAAAAQQLLLVSKETHPCSRPLSGLGDYRLVASPRQDGSTVVTGLPLHDVNATVNRLAVVGGGIAGGAIIVGLAAAAVIVRLTLRPLRRVAATAGRVAELTLDRGEVPAVERVPVTDTDPRTEVGAVGSAVNRMLDHVDSALSARQASETRVRQFVADASHELRTPLAAIRGYAELTRRSGEDVPRDVAHALRRVESEAGRMTTLVEDLLLLARLDSGRPLARDDVDLSALVVDAVSDAHATAPDHAWQLELADEVHVVGDGARLHQVVANLLANARTHTPPGTRVTVGLQQEDGAVVLRVVDDGPGISPTLVPQLFERFARGDSSRSRAAGSTGLGLAIVDAVVGAHGGTVTVDSAPGRTAFLVRIPVFQD